MSSETVHPTQFGGGTELTADQQAAVDALDEATSGEAIAAFAAIYGIVPTFYTITAGVTSGTAGGSYA